jgi:hypothetical protein
VADPRQVEHAPRGWVQPGEVVLCDVCGRRIYLWELHHLVPISWGGSDSRLEADRQVIWIRVDGDCHGVIHMILDRAKRDGGWPVAWLEQQQMPHLVVEAARRGWNGWKRLTFDGVNT